MMEHELKIEPKFLARIKDSSKTFEIRKNDRDFQVGDTLILKEFDPKEGWPNHGVYDSLAVKVTYLTTAYQQDGYVVMGLSINQQKEVQGYKS